MVDVEEEEEKQPQPAMMKEGEPAEDGQRRKPPRPPEPQKCPRCESTNTKFCYYNNYSVSQPRYFCKTCKRYWTKGGSLRNIPYGGGSRKTKRPMKSSITTTTSFANTNAKHLPSGNNSSLANTHNQLQHQLFLTKARAAAANANVTTGIGSLIHQSVYGMGGIESNGYCFHGLTTLPTIQQPILSNHQQQMVDLRSHQRLPSVLHNHELVNFQTTGIEGSSPASMIMPMANGGGSSSSPIIPSSVHLYGWQQSNANQISATTVTNSSFTPVPGEGEIGRNNENHLWLKNINLFN